MSRWNFWNWIGLPSASDIQSLRDNLSALRAENQRLSSMLNRTNKRIVKLEEALIFRQKRSTMQLCEELREQIERSVGELANKLANASQSNAEQQEKIISMNDGLREQIERSVGELAHKLADTSQSSAEQQEKIISIEDDTYKLLSKSARNQDELLRILIINTLNAELVETIDKS